MTLQIQLPEVSRVRDLAQRFHIPESLPSTGTFVGIGTGDRNYQITVKDLDYASRNEKSLVANLPDPYQNGMAQLFSEQARRHGVLSSGEALTQFSSSDSYRAVHRNPAYRNLIVRGWHPTAEKMIQGDGTNGFVILDPQVDSLRRYQGKAIPIKIRGTAPSVLREAGVFPREAKVSEGRVNFSDPDYPKMATFYSAWDLVGNCLHVGVGRPSDGKPTTYEGLNPEAWAALKKVPVRSLDTSTVRIVDVSTDGSRVSAPSPA